MFPRAIRIARIGGVDVRVDPSWLFITLLVVWVLQGRFGAASGRSVALSLTMAAVGSLLFFVSVLAHELAHALEGKHRGVEVHGITLFLFGGVTEMDANVRRPRDEFAVSAIGPYVSLVLAAGFGLVVVVARSAGLPAPVGEVAGVLGWINVALALFNLIPGAPLDGGRVLRSLIWAVTKDRHRATRIASWAGQAVAALLALLALWTITVEPQASLDALWLVLIAWFMWQAARAERRQAATTELLDGRTVASVIPVPGVVLPADAPLDQVADVAATAPAVDTFPVADDDGVVGALRLAWIRTIEPPDRPFRSPRDIMTPVSQLPAVAADAPVLDLLKLLGHDEVVAVTEPDGRVRTVVGERDVSLALERLYALQKPGRSRIGPPS
jgi:Zn-dependent protease